VVPRFDAAGLLRRARRNARMSQRDMARAVGVGKSTIGQAERDHGSVTLPVLLAALAIGGIDLVAVDHDGEVETMRLDAVRDRRHRKLPAHRHAWVASEDQHLPEGWQGSRRRSAPVRWSLRPSQSELAYLPPQHPGPEDVAAVRRRDADKREFRIAWMAALRRSVPARIYPLPACTCSDECVQLGMACPPSCRVSARRRHGGRDSSRLRFAPRRRGRQRKRRSRSEFVTTNTELNAIAAPASNGLARPSAASGNAATL
jgi:transcriptional regulator with XRE-family HTH domain